MRLLNVEPYAVILESTFQRSVSVLLKYPFLDATAREKNHWDYQSSQTMHEVLRNFNNLNIAVVAGGFNVLSRYKSVWISNAVPTNVCLFSHALSLASYEREYKIE